VVVEAQVEMLVEQEQAVSLGVGLWLTPLALLALLEAVMLLMVVTRAMGILLLVEAQGVLVTMVQEMLLD
jgi:hypothetical protein